MRNTRNCPGDDSPPGDSAWQPSLRRRQRISSSEDEDKENSAVGLTSSRRPEPLPGMSKALAHSRVPRRRLQKRVQSPGDDTLVQLDETSAPAGPSHSLPHSSGNVSGLKTSASAIVVIHSTSSESSDAAGSPFLGIGGRRPRAAALGGVLNDSDSSLDDPLGISRARACSRSAAKQPALMDRASNLPRGASTAQLAHGAGGRSPDHLASDGMPPSQRRGNNETPIDSDSDLDDPLGISVARASLSAARRQLISPMSRMSSDARQDGCVFLPRNSLAPLVEPAGPPSSSKPYSWRHGTMPQIQGDFECGGAGHPENPKKGTVRVAGCEAGGKTATTAASQNVLSSKCLDGSAALSPSLGAPSALPRQQGSHTRPCVALDSPEPNDLQGGAERISEMPGHGTPDQADSIVSTAMTPSKWSGLRLTSAPPRATCRNPVHSEGRPVLAPVEGSSQQISGPEAVFRAQPSAAHRAATVRNLAVTNLAWGDAGSPWCAPTSTNVDSRAIQWLQAGAAQRDEDDWIEETSDGDLQQESKRMDRPYLGPGTSVAWGGEVLPFECMAVLHDTFSCVFLVDPGSARQGPPGVLDKDLVNAITEPWWSRLEDFVPVLSIKAGYDPRNGANVHINYMECVVLFNCFPNCCCWMVDKEWQINDSMA